MINFDEFIKKACEFTKIDYSELVGKARRREICLIRYTIASILHNYGLPYTDIGKLLNRNHGSIMYGLRGHEGDLFTMPEVQDLEEELQAIFDDMKFTQFRKITAEHIWKADLNYEEKILINNTKKLLKLPIDNKGIRVDDVETYFVLKKFFSRVKTYFIPILKYKNEHVKFNSGGRVIEEKQGANIKVFEYDRQDNVIKVYKNERIIEEYSYEDNRLIKATFNNRVIEYEYQDKKLISLTVNGKKFQRSLEVKIL